MGQTKIPKERLGPLAIVDADVFGITLDSILDSNATNNQVPQFNESTGKWEPVSLASGSVFVDNEEPVGIKNSINKVFTIAHLPAPPSSIQLFVGGVLMQQGASNDYTVDNQTITMNVAPSANDSMVVFYRR